VESGARVRVSSPGEEGEMTQTMYAHVNKQIIKKKKERRVKIKTNKQTKPTLTYGKGRTR
jgi:hypothetical protein